MKKNKLPSDSDINNWLQDLHSKKNLNEKQFEIVEQVERTFLQQRGQSGDDRL